MLKHPHRLLALAAALLAGSQAGAAPVEFNRDIRPILAETCFHCHGPDPGSRKASLRLDTEAGFFKEREGKFPVVKGKPDQSELYRRLITTEEDDVMPPKKEHKDLKPAQVALVKAWIEQGAPWQPHWSFIKPERPKLPEVKNAAWVRNPVDRFILGSLEKAGLQPAPEADRYTLARRLSLDLTGLPPEPEVVAAFVNDKAPDAYERLVEQFMKSEHWGEHRGRYWLDAARYADTHGMHFDNYREMWPYRDWVINAFNRNQPFDQFTVEQIAGDMLPHPTESQRIATGFQRCNITTNEGGTIDEENLMLYAADRVQTMGWVYMGLTTNCAQCHDHKFDPFTQRDYYSMAAFFRNTTQAAKDGNIKDTSPILVVVDAKDQPRWTALPAEIAAATKQRDLRKAGARKEFDQWLVSAKPEMLEKDLPSKGLIAHVPLNEGAGSEVTGTCTPSTTIKATGPITWTPKGKIGPAPVMGRNSTFELGGLGDYEKNQPFSYGAWIKAGKAGVFGGIIARMDEKDGYRGWDLFQSDRSLAVHIVHQWPEDAMKVETRKPVLKPGVWQHVFVTYNGSGKAGGIKIFVDGVEELLKVGADALKPASSIRTTTAMRIGQRSGNQIFDGGSVQDALLYSRAISPAEIKSIGTTGPLHEILAAASDKRTPKQREALFDHYLVTRDAKYQQLNQGVAKLDGEREAIKARSPVTHVQEEKMNSKAMASILIRGAYDRKGEEVEANSPGFLPSLPAGAPRNRMGLANWLVDANNPLTGRVTVNRFWQEVFGTGIVKTSEDFGIMGSSPSHPELLDWLAVEFRENGWDVKKFFRLLVTSAAYRQAATATPEKVEKDPANKLLSRGPRFRMDGELIRDYALAASGTLSAKMGGPGTKPYQPDHVWDQVGIGNTRNYVQDKGENLYRRTVYDFWKRMAPPPNMDIFNAPAREVACVRRDRTDTPLQALVTMNDPQFVEAARNLAQHALAAPNAPDYIAQRLLCRPLKDQERGIVAASYKDLLAYYQGHAADAKSLLAVGESTADPKLNPAQFAAWTMVCNQMMNLDEVLNK